MSACNCIGPQNGQPLCPCMMRGVQERDGRYYRPEQDLGPVSPYTLGKITPAVAGWQCPNCGKAHPPTVKTCPEPAKEKPIRERIKAG